MSTAPKPIPYDDLPADLLVDDIDNGHDDIKGMEDSRGAEDGEVYCFTAYRKVGRYAALSVDDKDGDAHLYLFESVVDAEAFREAFLKNSRVLPVTE